MANTFIDLEQFKEKLVEQLIDVLELDEYTIDLSNMSLDVDYEVIIKIESIKLFRDE